MRNFSRLTAALAALVLMALAHTASAADSWQAVRSDGDNFQAMFPGKTEFASRDVANNGGTQHTWQYNVSDIESYTLAAITYPEGSLPAAPDMDFYKRILDGFAGGSECKLRGVRAATLAGHPGVESMCDPKDAGSEFLVDMLAVGNRLYMLVSSGATPHQSNVVAVRFRDSFKLIKP